jgi:uncharacterized repeat protein (TIGR03803 family)
MRGEHEKREVHPLLKPPTHSFLNLVFIDDSSARRKRLMNRNKFWAAVRRALATATAVQRSGTRRDRVIPCHSVKVTSRFVCDVSTRSVSALLTMPLLILMAILLFFADNAFATQFTVLHNLRAQPAANPNSGLIIGPDGGFYGTTGLQGESGCPPKLCGAIFEIKRTSSGWEYQVIHNFRGPKGDGELPNQLLFDSAGNLYGTTLSEGLNTRCFMEHTDCGTVFKLSRRSKGGWAEKVLYRFTGGADGALPDGNLVLDAAGNLYGTTVSGGSFNGDLCSLWGCGVIYELSPGAGGWTETVLYTFTGGGDGLAPRALTPDTNGNFLGVAAGGGTVNSICSIGCGTLFELTPGAGGWSLSVLYSFTGGSDGWQPSSRLIFDTQGNVFGTAAGGGLVQCESGCGTVFELSPNGSGWSFSDVYSFSGSDGELPHGIIFDAAGNLFGVADGGKMSCQCCGCGVLFKLVPGSGNWTETVLYKFKGTSDGAFPNPVILDRAGRLFGTAAGGGSQNRGTIFKFTP